jgi:FkbM family methyltransferase
MDLSWLNARHNFQTLIDIGANNGDYGLHLSKVFGVKEVHAFEPLPNRHAELKAKGFTLHPVALADRNGEAQFHVNAYDAASSLLPLDDATRKEWPEASEARTIPVKLARLDDELAAPAEEILIKVDAQGAEEAIIAGGQRIFRAASAVIIEMTFVSLYKGEALFNGVHRQLDALGFGFIGIKDQYQAKNGEPLFAHCIYERR